MTGGGVIRDVILASGGEDLCGTGNLTTNLCASLTMYDRIFVRLFFVYSRYFSFVSGGGYPERMPACKFLPKTVLKSLRLTRRHLSVDVGVTRLSAPNEAVSRANWPFPYVT